MTAVIWVLMIGLAVGAWARRPVTRSLTVALVGAYAGALVGGLAGTVVAGIAPALPWSDAGIVLGGGAGALMARVLDQRLR